MRLDVDCWSLLPSLFAISISLIVIAEADTCNAYVLNGRQRSLPQHFGLLGPPRQTPTSEVQVKHLTAPHSGDPKHRASSRTRASSQAWIAARTSAKHRTCPVSLSNSSHSAASAGPHWVHEPAAHASRDGFSLGHTRGQTVAWKV